MNFEAFKPNAPETPAGEPSGMNDEDFRLFRDFIRAQCGIYFGDSSKFILEKRIGRLLQRHRLRRYRDYYYYLLYDRRRDEELAEVVDAITTNETYFFREDRQLKAFSDEILPELHARKLARGDRSLRLWSAGCSTGEEPYTLAALILESRLFAGWRVEIFASDINRRVLQAARKGIYGASSFRVAPREAVERHFSEKDGKWRISDEIKRYVSFSHLNLLDRTKIGLLATMDVICCRNVIIYFDAEAKKEVIHGFHEKLAPGGYLMLGHSESLINISAAFKLRHFKNDLIYQKPGKPTP